MRIDLTPEQERLIQRRIQTGAYENGQDVVSDALGILEQLADDQGLQDDILASAGMEDVRRRVLRGIDQIERGEGITLDGDGELRAFGEDIKARGRKRRAARTAAQSD
jgi:Arc/MetJ-type ribon-helix-helix transcriptional regulator